jgi:adhesin transport system outer membrane protein
VRRQHADPRQPLEDALSRLIVEHPQIREARKTLEAERAGVDIARADFLPTLELSAETGPESIDSPTTRSSGINKNFTKRREITTLTLTQNLFNGWLSASNVRTAQINAEIARLSLTGTLQGTIFSGVFAYVDVLRQKRLLELARENESRIQTQLNLEDERVQRGSGVAVDVLQAKSRLQLAKERRVSIEGDLQDSISRFRQVYDYAPDIDAMLDPDPPVTALPTSLDDAIEIAVSENPATRNAAAEVEVDRESRREAAADLYPTIDLEGEANYESNNNGTLGVRRDYSLIVRATWELFSGFSTRHELRQNSFNYRAAKDNQLFVRRQVEEQVRLAWQALLTSRERLELLENAVNIAAEVFESRKKLREAGKETVINVLDAENEVNNAQVNYTSAAYDERIAVYQLLQAIGRLDPTTLGLTQQ